MTRRRLRQRIASQRLSLGLFAFEVGACVGVLARLGDRDPVERVELAVAAAVEPVALDAA
jgi:hypothetical protein